MQTVHAGRKARRLPSETSNFGRPLALVPGLHEAAPWTNVGNGSPGRGSLCMRF